MNPRRLYRSRYDRQLAGVAAGMAEYLELDPTLVRILWILSALFGGFTIVLYVILAFVIPVAPAWAYRAPAGAYAGQPATGAAAWGQASTASPAANEPSPDGAPDGDPGTQPASGAEGGAIEGWITNPAWTSPTGSPQAPGWGAGWAPATDPADAGRRGPGAGFYAGIVLIVFGVIAFGNAVIPGLVGTILVGPALLVAIGAALLLGSVRRTADPS